MKKKMVCLALFVVLGVGLSLPPAQAMTDEYAPPAEDFSQGGMEDDGLPPGYEFELEETDQPFMTDDSFPADQEEGGVLEELEEDSPEMIGSSSLENQ